MSGPDDFEEQSNIFPEEDPSVSVDEIPGMPPGVEDVKDLETSLGAAASGVLLEVDQEQARLRLRDAQVILAELGYLQGHHGEPGEAIDGTWGPKMRDAISLFQAEHEIDRSGQLDGETYEALLSAHETGLEMQSSGLEQDDFEPMHAEKPLNDT